MLSAHKYTVVIGWLIDISWTTKSMNLAEDGYN